MKKTVTVYLIEDNQDHVILMKRALKDHPQFDFHFCEFFDGMRALEHLQTSLSRPDLVILDYKMPGKNGFEILNELEKSHSSVPVIMITSYGTIESAVKAIKDGAFDYLPKPFAHPSQIVLSVEKALRHREIVAENHFLRSQMGRNRLSKPIVSRNPIMKSIADLVAQIAPTESTVLITGESGTGKEILAHQIHSLSPRQNRKFVAINCSTLPENLLESELFGHVKGAFTGAVHDKIGLLKEAHGGTFFFDEIAELPMPMQTKLLRFMQNQEIRPIGSVRSEQVDVRVIAATNRILAAEVKQNRFREDLYYRVNVIHIDLPPLRERKEDIPLFIQEFVENHNQIYQKKVRDISPESLAYLQTLSWPGNIRELKNTLERALIFTQGAQIELNSLSFLPEITNLPDLANLSDLPFSKARGKALHDFTSHYLEDLLRKNQGNVTLAAKAAKIGRQSFHRLLKIHHIQAQEYR